MRDDVEVTRIVQTAHHRNGISGVGFQVTIAEVIDGGIGRRMLVVDFGKDAEQQLGGVPVAVFDLAKLAGDDIGFGSNSWRGDVFAGPVRAALRKEKGGE